MFQLILNCCYAMKCCQLLQKLLNQNTRHMLINFLRLINCMYSVLHSIHISFGLSHTIILVSKCILVTYPKKWIWQNKLVYIYSKKLTKINMVHTATSYCVDAIWSSVCLYVFSSYLKILCTRSFKNSYILLDVLLGTGQKATLEFIVSKSITFYLVRASLAKMEL